MNEREDVAVQRARNRQATLDDRHRGLKFRPHIAGLRAIAVLGVVLFHFGAGWLPGGFLGVDIFFVISGFLISKSMLRDMEGGVFSLIEFYERRARRILPALLAVTLATAVASAFLLFPGQLVAFAKSAIAAATFTSNLYFYASTDYFSPAAIETPLLHYWSLGVEEQFYLVFPLLILAVRRLARRALPALIVALLLTSLLACEAMLRLDPAAAFYLLPFRAFEFLVGTLLALPGMRFPASPAVGSLASGGGAALLLASFLLVDETMRFPGIVALLPCLGTALAIWGAESVPSTPARLLSAAPLAFVGAISYSLYLVHWPIAVFWTMLAPDTDRLLFLAGGTLASLALAVLSWRLVERPVREKRRIFTRRVVFAMSGTGLALLAAAAVPVIRADGFPGRLDAEVQRILAANNGDWQYLFRDGTCFLNPEQGPNDLDRKECLPNAHPDVVLWGSSRIAQFYRGLAPLLAERGLTLGQITASACPPHLGRDIPGRPNCRSVNDFALAEIERMRPALLIVGGDGLETEAELAGLSRTIDALTGAGIRTVVLGTMVTHRQRVPNILASRLAEGNRNLFSNGDTVGYLDAATRSGKEHYGGDPRIQYISPKGDLCGDQGCLLESEGHVLYYDEDHFTLEGSRYYAAKLLALIRPQLTSR